MDSALAIVGFYFTLIGFISGLFFTRLDGWYGSIREFEGSLQSLSDRNDYILAKSKKDGLKASAPTGSFIAVGFLTSALTLLSLFVPIDNENLNLSPNLYLRLPIVVTVLAYWGGGYFLFCQGNSLLNRAKHRIDAGIQG